MNNAKNPSLQDLTDAKFIVSFISLLPKDAPGYSNAADQMMTAVKHQQGFVGVYSARNEDGIGITVSYWSHLEAIAAWKVNKAHRAIQKRGKTEWYDWYQLQVGEIVRSSEGGRSLSAEQAKNI